MKKIFNIRMLKGIFKGSSFVEKKFHVVKFSVVK